MYKYMKMYCLLVLTSLITLQSCAQNNDAKAVEQQSTKEKTFKNDQGEVIEKIIKPDAEWKKELSDEEFYILREKGTERAFTGALLKNKEDGVYTCAACQLPLFASETKFKSGTGWPSFYAPIDGTYVKEEEDKKYGMVRTEVLCNRCDGHLGHVFNDGPKPTGLRYCINSVSLNFAAEKDGGSKP